MNASLRTFIADSCHVDPAARMPLVEFLRAYQDSLPASDKDAARRGRVVAQLIRAGYEIGLDADKRFHVGGLTLAGSWRTVDGHLVFAGAHQ